MKSLIKQGFLLGLLLLFAGNVWAFPISQNDVVEMTSVDGGNPYTMTLADGSVYKTFCVEKEHYFNPNAPNNSYTVASVGQYAVGGGPGYDGSALGDPISDESKWLMASWLDGTFTDASIVQNAIWYMEEEDGVDAGAWYFLAGMGGVYNPTQSMTDNDIASAIANSSFDFTVTKWDIQVVNLTNAYGTIDNQSQLVAAPVPEPATMVLFGIGLIGLAGIGRRKVKK